MEARHASVAAELPDLVVHVGFVLAVAGYPEAVAPLDVGGEGQVVVGKALIEVEDGSRAGGLLDDAQPCAHRFEEHQGTAHLFNLLVRRLHVKHRWQVAPAEASV